MLMDLLSKASTVAMLSFVISSMLAMGAGLTVSQIIQPLRNPRLIVFALLANFVLMPLCALALSTMLPLDEPFGVGLLLLGCAAGAPFLPKLAELAKGNLPFAVGTMVLLMVVTVAYLPIVLPLLLPGVAVNPAKIAQSLVLLMLLPLGIGLALKSRYRGLGRTGEANTRLDFQRQSHPADMLDHCSQHRQGSTSVRHAGHPRRASVYCIRLRDWLVARRARRRHKAGAGLGYWPAQHRRRARGRESELQRSPGGRDGHRRRDSRLDYSHAAFSCVGQSIGRMGVI